MNKVLFFLPIMMVLVSCAEPLFKENKDITKYALDKYSEKLTKEKVKFLKCYPLKDGTMKATYTTASRDNSFPATIRFDYINKAYNVYFDNAYLNEPKKNLINDIDNCFLAWEKLKDSNQTWK